MVMNFRKWFSDFTDIDIHNDVTNLNWETIFFLHKVSSESTLYIKRWLYYYFPKANQDIYYTSFDSDFMINDLQLSKNR